MRQRQLGVPGSGLITALLLALTSTAHPGLAAPMPTASPSVGAPVPPANPAKGETVPAPTPVPKLLFAHSPLGADLVERGPKAFLDASQEGVRRFLEQGGIHLEIAGPSYTFTTSRHYLRYNVESHSGLADGQDLASTSLVTLESGHPLVDVEGLCSALHIELDHSPSSHLYTLHPRLESLDTVRDKQGRRLVLRASLPVSNPQILSTSPLRLRLPDLACSSKAPSLRLDELDMKVEPDAQPASGVTLTCNTPPFWKAELETRLLKDEVVVDLEPDFRLEPTLHPQVFETPQTTHEGASDTIVLKAPGPFQYYWSFDPTSRVFTLDLPRAELRDLGALQGGRVEQASSATLPTGFFTCLRLRFVLTPNSGVEVTPLTGPDTQGLSLRLFNQPTVPTGICQGHGLDPQPPTGSLVVLDPGHGGSDPGAINKDLGLQEKDITLDLCLRLREELKRRNLRVLMTREDDRDLTWANSPDKVELGARVHVANQARADLFISIHCNASPSRVHRGSSYHWYKSSDLVVARALTDSLHRAAAFANHGPIKNRFYVLRHTTMPALLVETAFISNLDDASRLADPAVRQRIAEHLAEAIARHQAARPSQPETTAHEQTRAVSKGADKAP